MQKLRGLLSKQSSPLPSSKDQRSGVGEDPALTSSMRVQSHALNPTRDIVKIVQRTNDSKEVIELNNGLDKIYIPLLVIAQLWLDACKRRAKHILHTEVLCPLIKIFTIISETHSTKYIAHHHLRSVSFSGMIRSYRLSHRFSWTPRSTKDWAPSSSIQIFHIHEHSAMSFARVQTRVASSIRAFSTSRVLGSELSYQVFGPEKEQATRNPIVFLHGLFGSKQNNRSISK